MKPLSEEEVTAFLGEVDPKYNNRKGVTVSRIKIGDNREETRVAIWNMVKVDNGYITCKKGGVSLNVEEFRNLVKSIPSIEQKVEESEDSVIEELFDKIKSPEAFLKLKRKYDSIKNQFEEGEGESSGFGRGKGKGKLVAKRRKIKVVSSSSEEDQQSDIEIHELSDESEEEEEDSAQKALVRSFFDDQAKVSRRSEKGEKKSL